MRKQLITIGISNVYQGNSHSSISADVEAEGAIVSYIRRTIEFETIIIAPR